MKKAIFRISISIIILASIIIGCTKDKIDHGAPILSFVVDSGFLYTDTVVASGDTAMIGVLCKWNGSDLIQTINTYLNQRLVSGPFQIKDSTGKELIFNFKITKSLNPIENWEIEVIDNKGHISKLDLTIYVDNSGGDIRTINAIMGAQKNPSIGSYYDLTNKVSYLKAVAETRQELIDLVAAYDYNEKSFISSPGSANLFGAYDFSTWGTKNLTLFCPTSLTKYQFDLTNKDNLLISSFHPEKAVDHIKNFKKNEIYSFKTYNNRYGLILFLAGATSEYGFITFDVKIQELVVPDPIK